MMSISVVAFSSTVLDSPTYSYNNDGIKYVEKTTTENGYTEKIFYGEYDTTSENAKYEWVLHCIGGENGVTTLSTVMTIAKDYEKTSGRKVMLAVNGDFFFDTGEFVDSYAVNGEVVKMGTYSNKNSLGFDNNGKVAIGRMTVVEPRIRVYDAEGNPTLLKIDNFNTPPAEGQISVYTTAGTYSFSNVGVTQVKTDASNLTDYPVLGTDYTMTTTGVRNESFTHTLRSGRYLIVYTSAHEHIFGKSVYGDQIDLVSVPGGSFEGCQWVIGGYDVLVNNGVVNTNCHTDNSGNVNRARTFMGFKEDGTGFVCVVDERNGSSGITVNKEAELAKALGAKYALELDGGGSSTMIVRINDSLVCRNSPSDGSMRAVANAILLVEKELPHECENPCASCGKCTNTSCTEAECADKCKGHHVCESVCDECGKCTDTACSDSACASKCEGHHVCESVCDECGKCTDTACDDDACASKCEGHDAPIEPENPETPENPENPDDSDEPTVEPSLPTEPETPDVVPEKQNPFLAFIMSIIEAIKNFFANLFK